MKKQKEHKMNLIVPSQIEDDVAGFIRRMNDSLNEPDVYLDFSGLKFVRPYGVLLFANALKTWIQQRSMLQYETGHNIDLLDFGTHQGVSYLTHINFFEYVGLDITRQTQAAVANRKYMPITSLHKADVQPGTTEVIQQVIERKCNELSAMIFEEDEEMEVIMLGYCLREVVRNVFEHADTDICLVMAQKFHYKDTDAVEVEIAIADQGCGVKTSLQRSHPEITSDMEALKAAIKPGISGSLSQDPGDFYGNSGYGLYTVSELGRQTGHFSIASVSKKLAVTQDKESIQDTNIVGTAVKLLTNTMYADGFANWLQATTSKGEEQSESQTGLKKYASLSSSSPSDYNPGS